MAEKLLTLSEVASQLRMPEADVTRLVEAGQLKALRLGGELLRFHPEDVAAWRPPRPAAPEASPATLVERVGDLLYRYDFYLVAALVFGVMVVLIVSMQ